MPAETVVYMLEYERFINEYEKVFIEINRNENS